MNITKSAARAGAVAALTIVGVAGWRLSRRWFIPAHHRTEEVTDVPSTPHRLTPQILNAQPPVQLLRDGVGPLFHRRYYADILAPKLSKKQLIQAIVDDINHCCPTEMAYFEKTGGPSHGIGIGDEFFIRLTGPWNGPVRTIEVTPTSFSFITLEGHLEAGEIQFRAIDHPTRRDATRFEIRSWTRSKDKVVDFAYDAVPLVKSAQEKMWLYFCKQVVELSGGELIGEIQVVTEKTDFRAPTGRQLRKEAKAPAWKQYEPRLKQYRGAKLNFDPTQHETFTQANGWIRDEDTASLPSEPPGEPVRNGSWELAKEVLTRYEFPDPTLIEGIFVPDDPLDQRVMVLKGRFLFFTFYFGARIASVIDEYRDDPERGRAKVWGYSYQTLEGHFEMGEIFFEIWKFLETGEVEFRIHRYSKTDYIANPFYRIGFRLFGRRLQLKFSQQALKRVRELVETRLEEGKRAQPLETAEVLPQSVDPKAVEAANETSGVES